MNVTHQTIKTVLTFLIFVTAPQITKAQDSDIQGCVNQIKKSWSLAETHLHGQTRHNTECQVSLQIADSILHVEATGSPLQIQFSMGTNKPEVEQTLKSCRVDKEKIHLVFEGKKEDSFEKRERVQLTLLKRQGKSLSMILSKREMRILRPVQQSNLICHLN